MQLWGCSLSNKKVLFHIDNQAVVAILNKKSSKSKNVMTLIRKLVLVTIKYNILIKAQYIPGKLKNIADALSRFNWQLFVELAAMAANEPTEIPDHLWKV